MYYSGGELAQHLDIAIPLLSLDKRGRRDALGFFLRLYRLIRRSEPDVIYSFLASSNVVGVMLKPFFPGLRIVWGMRSSLKDPASLDWVERSVFWMERHSSPFADLAIYNSEDLSKSWDALGFPQEQACVIPNGFDTQYFRPDPNARYGVRDEWGIPREERVFGIVGRLNPVKDHPTFLQAARRLTQLRDNVHFVIVGDGNDSYKHEIRRLSKKLGLTEYVTWVGFRSNMPAVYNALDVLVSASTGESFPNTVGEAMACGTPCVVTDVGDSRWLVGDTGIVVSPRDPEALARAMDRSLIDLDDVDRQRIRARIVERFSLDRLVENTDRALRSLL